jgi:uncharacterized protein YraI
MSGTFGYHAELRDRERSKQTGEHAMKSVKSISLAAALIALTVGVAAASPAIVLVNLNVRTGPGPEYPAITTLPGGTAIDVYGCGGGWCQTHLSPGRSGFVSQAYLSMGPGPRSYAVSPPVEVYTYPPRVYAEPGYYPGYYYERPYYGRPYYGRPYYRRYGW